MQYTGLKDRNGKPIYEGDVLLYHRGNSSGGRWLVEWDNEDLTYTIDLWGYPEIIGNKWENPELIK